MKNAFVMDISDRVCRLFDNAADSLGGKPTVDLQNVINRQSVDVLAN